MKNKLAMITLVLTLALGMTSIMKAAVTLTLTVSVSQYNISLSNARYGVLPGNLEVSSDPGQIFVSYHIGSTDNFVLDSTGVNTTKNGQTMSSENFTSYTLLSSPWTNVGYYGTNSYTSGSFNQGSILVGWGEANISYPVSMIPGDVYTFAVTCKAEGQAPITSIGTVTYIPEPTSISLTILGTSLCLLRRKRM